MSESICFTIKDKFFLANVEDLVGKLFYVGWPMTKLAYLQGVMTANDR